MEKTQREYYLNEQMKAIQKELGDGEEGKNEIGELEEKISRPSCRKEAAKRSDAELKKLKNMSPMSPKPRLCAIIWTGFWPSRGA